MKIDLNRTLSLRQKQILNADEEKMKIWPFFNFYFKKRMKNFAERKRLNIASFLMKSLKTVFFENWRKFRKTNMWDFATVEIMSKYFAV